MRFDQMIPCKLIFRGKRHQPEIPQNGVRVCGRRTRLRLPEKRRPSRVLLVVHHVRHLERTARHPVVVVTHPRERRRQHHNRWNHHASSHYGKSSPPTHRRPTQIPQTHHRQQQSFIRARVSKNRESHRQRRACRHPWPAN